jgi:hypothetical protein
MSLEHDLVSISSHTNLRSFMLISHSLVLETELASAPGKILYRVFAQKALY